MAVYELHVQDHMYLENELLKNGLYQSIVNDILGDQNVEINIYHPQKATMYQCIIRQNKTFTGVIVWKNREKGQMYLLEDFVELLEKTSAMYQIMVQVLEEMKFWSYL